MASKRQLQVGELIRRNMGLVLQAEGPYIADPAHHPHPALKSILSDGFKVLGVVQRDVGDILRKDPLHLPYQRSPFLKIQGVGRSVVDPVEMGVLIATHIPASRFVVGGVEEIP